MAGEQRSKPRIAPLHPDEMDDDTRDLFDQAAPPGARTVNIFATLLRHPGLYRRWLPFGAMLLRGRLPVRDRELMILRTAWVTESSYEWAQHVPIARDAGVTEAEVEAIANGADDPSWSLADATLIRAVDELHDDGKIGDDTWAALAERYDERQLIELPMLVGQYHMVAFTANTLGIEIEPGLTGFAAEA